jgi:Zn-dependent M28 family amino/carboxypeptidase
MRRVALPVGLAASVFSLTVACTSSVEESDTPGTSRPPATMATSATEPSSTPPTTAPTTSVTSTTQSPPPRGAEFRAGRAFATLRYLALTIGPREATSHAFARAARWVQGVFESYGYDVTRQPLHVPAGNSWGVDVPASSTWNVVAAPPGFDARQPHRVVGAHLDTVPQAPGAEDDGSGIGVVLELARMAAIEPPKTPVVFVAFAAEEPRGDGEALHHFGSTAYVDRLDAAERRQVKGMVALDRVGVATNAVPVCTGGLGSTRVQRALLRAGDRAGMRTIRCLNTGADHWSFEKAGIPAARVGGVSYPEYHSAADLPRVVSRAQLARSATVVWQWITH